jgi:hypothetical protein
VKGKSVCRIGIRPPGKIFTTRFWCWRSIQAASRAFGAKGQVDPVRHLIATSAGWGGKDATYLSFSPSKNDGNTIYKLNVKDVPVDAFWPVSFYNAAGC